MNWNEIWDTIWNFIKNNGTNIVNAILVLIFGYVLIKIVNKLIKSLFAKSKINKVTQSFCCSILSFALKFLLVMAVLNCLGIQTTGLIAVLSAAGLAVSLSLKSSLSNLANGIVIITTQPFEVGDEVKVNNTEGVVKSINMLTSTIVTFNNEEVTLPNSAIVENAIINYSRLKTRRSVLSFSVAYEANVNEVKKILLDVIHSDGRTLLEPAPSVVVKELGEDYITLSAYFWMDSEDYYAVNNYVKETVINEFKKHNIPRNYKKYTICSDCAQKLNYNDTPLTERVEKIRKEDDEQDLFEILEDKAKEYESKRKKRFAERKKRKLEKKRKKESSTLEVSNQSNSTTAK